MQQQQQQQRGGEGDEDADIVSPPTKIGFSRSH